MSFGRAYSRLGGWALGCGLLVCVVAAACSPPVPPPRSQQQTAKEPPSNALEIARASIQGKTGALLHMNLLRSILAASSTLRLGHWGEVAAALGIDPIRDTTRVFITSMHALDARSTVVIETNADRDYLLGNLVAASKASSEKAAARATDDWERENAIINSTPRGTPPRVELLLENGARLAVAVGNVVVAVPYELDFELDRFSGPLTLPEPFGKEAASFFAFDLASTLGSVPTWPDEIVAAQAFVELEPAGGAIIRFDARTLSPLAAEKSAATLTQQAHDLLTFDLKLFEVEFLTPPVFSARGERVEMVTSLSAEELSWLLAFSGRR